MSVTNLHLQWNTSGHSKQLNDAFTQYLTSSEFSDVTLVCDDRSKIPAHKLLLSALSPMFKSMLSETSNNSNSFIFMRGVKNTIMRSLVEFMYCGQTTIAEDSMSDFLSAAEDLEMKHFVSNLVETQASHDPVAETKAESRNVLPKLEPETTLEEEPTLEQKHEHIETSHEDEEEDLEPMDEEPLRIVEEQFHVDEEQKLATKEPHVNEEKLDDEQPSVSNNIEGKSVDDNNSLDAVEEDYNMMMMIDETMITKAERVSQEMIEHVTEELEPEVQIQEIQDHKPARKPQPKKIKKKFSKLMRKPTPMKPKPEPAQLVSEPAASGSIQCPDCTMMFSSLNEISVHFSASHRRYPCTECKFNASTKPELREHILQNHVNCF